MLYLPTTNLHMKWASGKQMLQYLVHITIAVATKTLSHNVYYHNTQMLANVSVLFGHLCAYNEELK